MKKIILTLLSFNLYAAPSADEVFRFENTDCEKNQSCDLLNFELKVYHQKDEYPNFQGRMAKRSSTVAEGRFETSSGQNVRNYAIVQYIEGCLYSSSMLDDGEIIINTNSHKREFYGKLINFNHPTQVIDSIDSDPIYASFKEDRHGSYRVTDDYSKSSLFDDSRHFKFLYNKPEIETPILIFSDLPTLW